MRLASLVSVAFALLGLVGCGEVRVEADPPAPGEPTLLPERADPASPPRTPATKSGEVQAVSPVDDGSFAEVVYVFMRAGDASRWMCTGTLVSRTTVVTAAHCLDPSVFVSYEIVAPLAPGRPRVSAASPRLFGGHYDDVANPDFGTLTLSQPIVLPVYAELTDVVANVEAGEAVSAAAVVRVDERAEAPLEASGPLPVSSTVGYGYAHGIGTPMFSKGGDSGAGLFLIEGGKMTHKLIGVARQPEPERDLDHFTRVDAELLRWLRENVAD